MKNISKEDWFERCSEAFKKDPHGNNGPYCDVDNKGLECNECPLQKECTDLYHQLRWQAINNNAQDERYACNVLFVELLNTKKNIDLIKSL